MNVLRPPGRRGKRSLSTRIFAAVRPGSDDAFAPVPPEAKAVTMGPSLARFAETLPAGVHAVLPLDRAGWRGKAAPRGPDDVAPPPPPYPPELTPVERVWLYLRGRFLSSRLHRDEPATVDALCAAWNAPRAETGRLTSPTSHPWLMHAIEQVRT